MSPSTHWACPSHDLFRSLSPGVVHVWRASLEDSANQAARYRSELSADELPRAERYRFPHPQNQFISTRGILRRLLSQYVDVPVGRLRIGSDPAGKPILIDPACLPVQFNVSHASGMALFAFTIKHPIGIDVENVDRTINAQDIAARYFAPRESSYLASLVPEQRTQAFFTYWTCKEAYLKMRGIGLTGGLSQCEIALDPDGVKAHVVGANGQRREDHCSLLRINAGQAHIGALAVECPSVEMVCWDWKD